MADYHETVRAKLKDLSSPSAATRRAAAYYLGEAGADEAITKLTAVYKSDPDPKVRQAAAYSLGMFRAVDQALKRGDQERVVNLLRRVVDNGRFGSRLRLRPAILARVEIVLVALLVLQLVLHVVLPNLKPLPGGMALPAISLPIGGGVDADAVLELTRVTYTGVRNDLATLQGQFQSILTGGVPNCTAFFNLPGPVVVENAGALPADVARLVDAVNAGEAVVAASYARLDSACYGDQPIDASEVGGLLAPVVAAQRALAEIEPMMNGSAAPAAVATDAPTATPTVEPSPAPPTETPTPTEIPATATPAHEIDSREHVSRLYGIIDSVSGPRNAAGLLRQAWTDTANAGTTRACTEPRPSIPEAYVMAPQDEVAFPQVAQATEQVNLALTLLNQGWDLFQSACAANALAQQAATGLQTATTAEDALRVADGLLQAARSGL